VVRQSLLPKFLVCGNISWFTIQSFSVMVGKFHDNNMILKEIAELNLGKSVEQKLIWCFMMWYTLLVITAMKEKLTVGLAQMFIIRFQPIV
jgi:hypothetical protein